MCNITKRRLCISYHISSTRADYNIFHVTTASTKYTCLTKCVRRTDCWAFNYFENNTCELLPVLSQCEEPRSQAGSTFTHLTLCKGETPLELLPRNWSADPCLVWIPQSANFNCPGDVLRGSDAKYCLSLAPYLNLYMPGWFKTPNGFRFVREDQRLQRCPNGYVVKHAVGCSTGWQNYVVGDPVPTNAIQVSVWRDGTPLYSVEYRHGAGGYYIGYYLPSIQKVFIMASRLLTPTQVNILVLNWLEYLMY